MAIYNISGDAIDKDNVFFENINLDYAFDEDAETNYTAIRVYKKRKDGVLQFPFVRQPSILGTAYDLANREGWYIAFNAGIGQGIVIENRNVITDDAASYHAGALPLTINTNGDLGFIDSDTTGKGSQIVQSGIVSAVCGFYPIIVNYEAYDYPSVPHTEELQEWTHAQRQIVGQFDNGDYAIITGEGRTFAGSIGFSIQEAQNLCKQIGLKFAYNLDGGGSTQTVLGVKNINHIYEGTTGRQVKSYIVFNGTDTYSIPNGS